MRRAAGFELMTAHGAAHYETDAMRAFAQRVGGSAGPGWVLYAVFAVLFGLYLGLNAFIGLDGNANFAAWKPMVWEMSSAVVIFAVIPLVVRFERRVPIDSKPRTRVLLSHLAAAFVFSAIHVAGILVLRKLAYAFAGESYEFGNLALKGFYEFQKDLITYAIIIVVVFAYRQFQVRRVGELRATELAAELSQAQLAHLTAQIEPHFLFNALNAISNRMHEDVDAADRMISDLGSLLRAAYDTDRQVLVPLESELHWLRGYTTMMTERFRGQLHFELQVQGDLEALKVPRLLLQPLVENSLRHGLPDGRGTLIVSIERRGEEVEYRVADDGIGLKDGVARYGTGLSNVARRLELLYPGAHRFELKAQDPAGTVAIVGFPVVA
jgi:two-component system LytT family sensor kinase